MLENDAHLHGLFSPKAIRALAIAQLQQDLGWAWEDAFVRAGGLVA
jgi:hypothetical protein